MSEMKPLTCALMKLVTIVALCLVAALGVSAQPQTPTPDKFVGNYKGTAKMDSGEMEVTLEIKFADGKVSGRAVTAQNTNPIASGEMVGSKLLLKFGAGTDSATLTLEKKEDKLVGDWIRGAQKGTVEFKKVTMTADEISGEWDAAADAQGQPFPFTLVLKLDGEKVTGSSSSQLGNSELSSGTWKDGKLSLVINGSSGAIGLMATLDGGKLIGDYDFAGQLQGKWVAVKKK
jgi:hypothetical protein